MSDSESSADDLYVVLNDSDDSDASISIDPSSSLWITLQYSLKIGAITEYYQEATGQLFDDDGNVNDPAPDSKAVAGSSLLDAVRDMVLHHDSRGKEAMLSSAWRRVKSAENKFRKVTDRFEVKLEQVKSLDSRWSEVDADEIRRSAIDAELLTLLMSLMQGRSAIPMLPRVTIPELPARSSLGPDMTTLEVFEHAKLASPKDTIRLVRMESITEHPNSPIRISTRTISLQDNVPYSTLSYTWGNPFGLFCSENDRDAVPRTDVPIICDGKRLDIGENLYRFLCRWRESLATPDETKWKLSLSDELYEDEDVRHPAEIWIDAICINQRDLEERNQQVSIMGDIYTNSVGTWAWLGEHDEFSEVGLTILQKLSHLHNRFESGLFGTRDLEEKDSTLARFFLPDSNSWGWFAVFALFQRQWFRRSWVVQEVTLSSRLLIQCGSAIMSGTSFYAAIYGLRRFDFLAQMFNDISRQELKVGRPSQEHSGFERSINELSGSRYHLCRDGIAQGYIGHISRVIGIKLFDPEILEKDRNGLKPSPSEKTDKVYELLGIWKLSQQTLCGDPRDKVFAVAALIKKNIYKTPNTIQDRRAVQPDYKKSVCEVYCDAAWFTLLTHASLDVLSMAGHISLKSEHNLPSWVPDLNQSSRFSQLNNHLFTLDNYLLWNPQLGWLASGGARWEIPPPAKRHGRHLDIEISLVGRIKVTEGKEPEYTDEKTRDAALRARFRKFLDFSTLLPPTYLGHPDGQSRLEVIWRTIILDAEDVHNLDAASPASPKYAASFEKLCKEAIQHVLDDIAAGKVDDTDLHRSTEAMRDMERLQDLSASFSRMDIEDDEDAFGTFCQRVLHSMATRRLFIADTGHVGCGESELCVGDVIAVVAGSSVPFLLRPISDGRYVLIGEAYVHGIMFGEHAMKPDVKWEPITLE
ncbi:hypothetical protein KVR01_007438 [Diaporthe batatas]|uniref:uncharacterized protein n=1 Tax=Diaporthe batatas TaxID=748121 RepID=UPI001D056AFA|nr:uncharacterized protein KVR01_007438 [Diaporthe batatas]KAG8162960.1 hypothetical protein KVR01_007438 [Diaporthe batatas]